MTPDTRNIVAASQRIIRLIRDLRRRNEAWACGDREYKDSDNSPDVAVYDRHKAQFGFAPMRTGDDLLADVVATIIAEEMKGTQP